MEKLRLATEVKRPVHSDRAATGGRPGLQRRHGLSGRRRWLGLVALTLGVAMIIVDATIVNVAIPSIIRDLHIGITQAEWANSIYSLVFAALLISVGRVGDVTGRRRVFIWGLLVFLGASLITALAPSGTVLLLRPVPAGCRRSADPPVDALDRERDVPRARAGDRVRDLGLGDRRDGGARPARRGLVRHQPELALGLLRQPPGRSGRARRHAALGRREPRSRRASGVRPTRCRAVDSRLPRRRLRADRGADLRLVDRPAGLPRPLTRRAVGDPVRLRARRALPRSVRRSSSGAGRWRAGRCSSTSRSSGSRPFATGTSRS